MQAIPIYDIDKGNFVDKRMRIVFKILVVKDDDNNTLWEEEHDLTSRWKITQKEMLFTR